MFYSRSPPDGVERKATKKTGITDLTPARKPVLLYAYGNVNKVRRIGAFPWGQTKKLPWVEAVATELASCLPVNAEARKEDRSLALHTGVTNGCCGGVTRPSGSLADWRPGYTSLSATTKNDFRKIADFSLKSKRATTARPEGQKVGATTDPRHGCSVNTTEGVSRLVRLHTKPKGRCGLNGWGTVPAPPEAKP